MQKQRSMLGNSAGRCKEVTLICLDDALYVGAVVCDLYEGRVGLGVKILGSWMRGWVAGMDSASGHNVPCRKEAKTASGLTAKFEQAQPRKAPVLGEGLIDMSILEYVCGPL
ncbi:hypothetical protein CRG98_039591 [Punica granatum]|uniref:Uncharacterized protein n=1 Tax=Punica granatum TaxID=22663 RepID=A0A2I0I7S3_PUNGR|nr:hypothetical protein CRG98_039591 [Punica granatum]